MNEPPRAPLYFNQASPSAYLRGHTRAVPLALAYMRTLERLGVRVLNGADVLENVNVQAPVNVNALLGVLGSASQDDNNAGDATSLLNPINQR